MRGMKRTSQVPDLFITPGIATTLRAFAAANAAVAIFDDVGSGTYFASRDDSAWAVAKKPDEKAPGQNAVTLTPVPRTSSATASVKDKTYALLA